MAAGVYNLPFHGSWKTFTDDELLAANRAGGTERDDAARLWATYCAYEKNRLSYFLAHGETWTDTKKYPREWLNDGVAFLNDRESDLAILLGPNQGGKTTAGVAWLALRILPCDKSWPCFSGEGDWALKWQPWEGPGLPYFIASFQWRTIQTVIWRTILEIFPDDELREYSPRWKPNSRRGPQRPKPMNWRSGAPTLPLACGNHLDFYCYSSPGVVFESNPYKAGVADEQMKENQFDAMRVRGRRYDIKMALPVTPVRVEGYKESGAESWICQTAKREKDKGLAVGVYRITVPDIPEHLWSAERKEKEYNICIRIPEQSGDERQIRKGRARYYAEFESASDMVYDGWNAKIQWIDPFPPKIMETCLNEWTLVRSVDHGMTAPCCCLWMMISPWNDWVLYRMYYESGGMGDHVRKIIEMSGNTRRSIGRERDDKMGAINLLYEEVQSTESYWFTVMDGRSFRTPYKDTSTTLGNEYVRLGLRCKPAEIVKKETVRPLVDRLFNIDPDRTHILKRLGITKSLVVDGREARGAPILYVFNTLGPFREEIESYYVDLESEKPRKRPSKHAMDALEFLALERPRYIGSTRTGQGGNMANRYLPDRYGRE